MVVRYYCKYFSAEVLLYFLTVSILILVEHSLMARTSCKQIELHNNIPRDGDRYFTNTWAVRILGGVSKAKSVARNVGQDFCGKVSDGLPNIYLFQNPKYPKRANFSNEIITASLKINSEITWAEQQVTEVRVTRRYFKKNKRVESELSWDIAAKANTCPDPESSNGSHTSALNLNDQHWPKQYYIKDCRKGLHDGPPNDLNIVPVWVNHRLFGKNIIVMVVDDGVETKHADLVDNYDITLGLDLQDNDGSPDPVHRFKKYSHGTQCAGIIGMKGNNSICGIGIAPSVTLGAVRLIGPKMTSDYRACSALLFKFVKAHIVSNAWGPKDDGENMLHLGHLVRTALKLGTSKGRGGLGLIYVFAAGNGKKVGDHCGCDALVGSVYTIAVASSDHRGKITTFSERCASIMVTAYSGGKGNNQVVAPDVGGDECTTQHFGTSGSMAMVSGVIALVLEANPKLTWRDVQHLLALTSQVAPLQHNAPGTWIKNAAGFYVSHDFGFGMLNANYMVEKAKSFKSVGTMITCVIKVTLNEEGVKSFLTWIQVEAHINGCEGTPYEVRHVEHVQLVVSLTFPRRGDLQIILTSPSGTNATLLDQRPRDSNKLGLRVWTFDSIMTWGESPKGVWLVYINSEKQKSTKTQHTRLVKRSWPFLKREETEAVCLPSDVNVKNNAPLSGKLTDLTFVICGTSGHEVPEHYNRGPRTYDSFQL